jgi:hypothetical protein
MRVAGAHGAIVESISPDLFGTLALVGGLGVLLVSLAQRYSLLEQRREARCPACGVIRRRGSCSCG